MLRSGASVLRSVRGLLTGNVETMRTWLAAFLVALGLALVASPVLANFAPGVERAGTLHHDAVHDGPVQDEQGPAKTLPALIVICCPATFLPVVGTVERVVLIQPVAWYLPPALDPGARSPALDPRPPRL
jgi:hypothetical protein